MTFADVTLWVAVAAIVTASGLCIAARIKGARATQLIAVAVVLNTLRVTGSRDGWFSDAVAIGVSVVTILLMVGLIVLVYQENARRAASERALR